jgi:hypothetical protein
MKNFKDKLWTILLIIMIGIPILVGILYIFGMLSKVSSVISQAFTTLSNGNWVQGVIYTLFVIVGLTNLIRGVFTASPREEILLESLPDWAYNLIVGLSFIGTFGFIVVFFNLLME